MNEGVSTIDVPTSEKKIGRGTVIGSAIREVRIPLGVHLPLERIRFPVPRKGHLLSPFQREEKGEKRRIPVIAENHIRIKPFNEFLDLLEIDLLHLQLISFALKDNLCPVRVRGEPCTRTVQGSPRGIGRIAVRAKFHHSKIGKTSIVHPHRLRRIGVDLENPIPFDLDDAFPSWENPFFVEIGLRQRDIAVVEGDSFFPWAENSWKLDVNTGISQFDLHHLYFVSAPELSPSCPLPPCHPTCFLKRMKEGKKISSLSLGIEARSKGFFESTDAPVFFLDPKDH
jgi:hypothetical protein